MYEKTKKLLQFIGEVDTLEKVAEEKDRTMHGWDVIALDKFRKPWSALSPEERKIIWDVEEVGPNGRPRRKPFWYNAAANPDLNRLAKTHTGAASFDALPSGKKLQVADIHRKWATRGRWAAPKTDYSFGASREGDPMGGNFVPPKGRRRPVGRDPQRKVLPGATVDASKLTPPPATGTPKEGPAPGDLKAKLDRLREMRAQKAERKPTTGDLRAIAGSVRKNVPIAGLAANTYSTLADPKRRAALGASAVRGLQKGYTQAGQNLDRRRELLKLKERMSSGTTSAASTWNPQKFVAPKDIGTAKQQIQGLLTDMQQKGRAGYTYGGMSAKDRIADYQAKLKKLDSFKGDNKAWAKHWKYGGDKYLGRRVHQDRLRMRWLGAEAGKDPKALRQARQDYASWATQNRAAPVKRTPKPPVQTAFALEGQGPAKGKTLPMKPGFQPSVGDAAKGQKFMPLAADAQKSLNAGKENFQFTPTPPKPTPAKDTGLAHLYKPQQTVPKKDPGLMSIFKPKAKDTGLTSPYNPKKPETT